MVLARYSAAGVLDATFGIGGIVVDNVSEVARVEAGHIAAVAGGGHPEARAYLSGTTRRDERNVGFIDIPRVFADIPMNPQACQLA